MALELIRYFIKRGKWVLLPIFLAAALVGGLLLLGSAVPAAAPFIYTIF